MTAKYAKYAKRIFAGLFAYFVWFVVKKLYEHRHSLQR